MKNIFILISILLLLVSCVKEKKQTDKIIDYAKTYGLVKYFYPGDEAAKLDWDGFNVFATQQLLDKNKKVQLAELFKWAPSIYFSDHEKKNDTSYLKLLTKDNAIYWQHIGNGKGKIGTRYKSARVNRKAIVLPNSNNDYGTLHQLIDREDYQERKLTAKAKIRISGTFKGRAYLSIRYKPTNQPWREFTSKKIKETRGDWMEIEVAHEISKNIERVAIVLYSICQTGYIDVDGITLVSQDIKNMSKKVLIQEDFSNSKLGDSWKAFGPNQDFKILKNGRKEMFFRASRTKGKLQEIEPLYSNQIPNPKIMKIQLTGDSQISFPLVLPSVDSVTLPKPPKKIWEDFYSRIEAIDPDEQLLSSESVRLSNIIKVWNVFQHFYPYFESTEVDWEDQLRIAIKRNKKDKDKSDHILTLKKMVAKLHDSHIGVYSSNEIFYPPFALEWIENKLVVSAASNTIKEIKQGDIVASINGIAASKYFDSILLQSSGAHFERKKYKAIYEALGGEREEAISLTITSAKSTIPFAKKINEDEFKSIIDIRPEQAYFEPLDSIKYIDLTRVTWDFIQEELEDISTSKGLIFDLRGYPKWRTHEIVRHFTLDTLESIHTYSNRYSYPNRVNTESIRDEIIKYFPKKPLMDMPKVFLTNANAISYSETFLNIVSHYKLASIVGSRTAGSTGLTNRIFLYGNISIPWTGQKVTDQNGNVFHGIGVPPDHEVNRTIDGVRKNKDEVFEYALKLFE